MVIASAGRTIGNPTNAIDPLRTYAFHEMLKLYGFEAVLHCRSGSSALKSWRQMNPINHDRHLSRRAVVPQER
jgi:hypothetical protein